MAQSKIDILDHDFVVPAAAQEGFTLVDVAVLGDHHHNTISVGGINGKTEAHRAGDLMVTGPSLGGLTVFDDGFLLDVDPGINFDNTASDPSFIDAVALFKGLGVVEGGTPDQRQEPGYLSGVVRHTLDDGFSE